MRWKQLTENSNPESVEEAIAFIKRNCKPYLKQNPTFLETPLYRGMHYEDNIVIKTIRTDRKPKDSGVTLHNIFEEAMKLAGMVARRSNSMFCTGSQTEASNYGIPYIVFPIGDFDFSYSKEIDDLTSDTSDLVENGYFDFLNQSEKVLVPQDFPSFKKYLPELYSYDELWEIKKKHDIDTSILIADFRASMHQRPDILQRMKVDVPGLADYFKEVYQNSDLPAGIKSRHEIMITGSKYVAISNREFWNLKDMWA